LGANFDAKARMDALSVAQQQMVEIAKALSTNAKVVIMDEPTAALSNRECEELYKITLKLRDSGVAVIFISHRMEDMYRLASSVTVFRDSQYIGTWDVDKISNEDLIMAMVGREINQLFPKKKLEIGAEVLRVEGLTQIGHFANISFSVHKGEIMALTGLVGAGRTEVCEAIFGISHIDSGKVFLDGKEIHVHHPSEAIAAGIGLLPEDRQKQGLVLEWEISKNITLSNLSKYIQKGILNVKQENAEAKSLSEKLAIKTPSIFNLASSLSGGNQQKIVVAKMLTSDLKIIILDEPTKGVDVGAKAAIYEIIGTLAENGYAIIMISSEMPEVLGMSDSIVVMKDGRVTATLKTPNVTQEDILHASMLVETNQN